MSGVNEQEQCPDDTHCCTCGRTLPLIFGETDPAFHGYCNGLCMDKAMTKLHCLVNNLRNEMTRIRRRK